MQFDLEATTAAFGLRERVVSKGVLVTSAFGYEPPVDAWQFAVQLMSTDGDTAAPLKEPLTMTELAELRANLPKLNTRKLTVCFGEDRTHALVVEGRLDLGTHGPEQVNGAAWSKFLPEGDGEQELRAFIDRSVNMLSELPMNRIRSEEGLLLANLLWPWGHGQHPRLPNLALHRGEPSIVVTDNLYAYGLARLVKFRPILRGSVGSGVQTNFRNIRETATGTTTYGLLDTPERFARSEMFDELAWWMQQFSTEVLERWRDERAQRPIRLLVAFPSGEAGFALIFDSERPNRSTFHLRKEYVPELPKRELVDVVENFLAE
jgi:hypothetical protein